MQTRTITTCATLFAIAVTVAVIVVFGLGMYLSRPLPTIVIPPPPPLPADNGFDDCVRATTLLKDTDKLDDLDPAKQPREAGSLLKLNRPALYLVRGALPKDYMTPQAKTWDEEFPYLKGFRNIARLFVVEGQLKESAGDIRGATECFLDARRFAALIPNGGTLLHWVMGRGVGNRGYAGLESTCHSLDTAECSYVLGELRQADAREPSMAQALEWERVAGLLLLRDFLSGKQSGGRPIGPFFDRALLGRGRSSVEDYELCMQALKLEAQKPFHTRQPVSEPKGIVAGILAPGSHALELQSTHHPARNRSSS